MKKKNVATTLTLKKLTVADLDKNSLRGINGGADTDPGSTCLYCPTNDIFCQPTKTMCTGSPC